MAKYDKISNRIKGAVTPYDKKIRGKEHLQTTNPEGGVSFALDNWGRLNRFLILGVEGNSFYQSQKTLVEENVESLDACLEEDGIAVVDKIVEISTAGRALKQDAGIFALASAAAYGINNPSDEKASEVRNYALSVVPRVCRTGTTLFMFVEFVQGQRGWGRALRRTINSWLNETPVSKLALQAWKYKSRNGWTWRDLMRLSHPVAGDVIRREIFTYMARPQESGLVGNHGEGEPFRKDGTLRTGDQYAPLRQIAAAETLLKLKGETKRDVSKAVTLITEYGLTHEAVPTQLRKKAEVWEALLEHMPLMAMTRNLSTMSSAGLLGRLTNSEEKVLETLSNVEFIRASKMHPMHFFMASKVYNAGRGMRGSLSWTVNPRIGDALEQAYFDAFGNVPVTGKKMIIAVDDSGSMTFGNVSSLPDTTVAEAAAAMALVNYRVEPNAILVGFANNIRELNVSKTKGSIRDISKHIGSGGGTDTTLPVKYAMKKDLNVDAIVSYTDNVTWGAGSMYGWGNGHLTEWVNKYEKKYGRTRFVNCAMSPNRFTDSDPTNPAMFEIAGLDSNTPTIISEILQGNL